MRAYVNDFLGTLLIGGAVLAAIVGVAGCDDGDGKREWPNLHRIVQKRCGDRGVNFTVSFSSHADMDRIFVDCKNGDHFYIYHL